MRLKNQKGFANLSESGKMLCSGFNSEQALKKAVIKYNSNKNIFHEIKGCTMNYELKVVDILQN